MIKILWELFVRFDIVFISELDQFRYKRNGSKYYGVKINAEDAKAIMQEKGLRDYQTDLISIATALFEKRASHVIYHKESKAKEKFDEMFNK